MKNSGTTIQALDFVSLVINGVPSVGMVQSVVKQACGGNNFIIPKFIVMVNGQLFETLESDLTPVPKNAALAQPNGQTQ